MNKNNTKNLNWRTKKSLSTIDKNAEIILSDGSHINAQDIAKIVDMAPEDFDTLKEVADWISEHEEEVSDIISGLNNKADKDDVTALLSVVELNYDSIEEIKELVLDMRLFKFPNATIMGEPTINHGQISGFSQTNYLVMPSTFDAKGRAFEIAAAFTTGTDVAAAQNIFGGKFCLALFIQSGKLNLRVSSNGTEWDIVNYQSKFTVEPSKTYYVKITFDRLRYKLLYSTNGVDYTEDGYVTAATEPHSGLIYIGVGNNFNNPFQGIINLNKCEIKFNNVIVWEGMDDVGLATRLATNLSNIDQEGEERIKEIVNADGILQQAQEAINTANTQIGKVEKLKNDVETYIGAGKETVVVSVTSSVEGVSVEDLTIYVYLNNSDDPLSFTTDEHGMATFRVDIGYQYRVVFPYIPGCATIADVTHTAGVAQRSVEVEYKERSYNTEEFNLTVLKWTGNSFVRFAGCNVHIKVDGVTSNYQTDSNGQFSIEIPIGKEYVVSFDQLEDLYLYGKKYVFNYVANSPRRDMMANYHDVVVGLFIVADDFAQYTKEEWLASGRPWTDAKMIKIANATLVASGNTFAINLDSIASGAYNNVKLQWCSPYTQFNSFPNGVSDAGLDRTVKAINEGIERSLPTPAATYCHNKIFEIGGIQLQGFLGAANQHLAVVANEYDLNDLYAIVRPEATSNFSNFIGANKWTADQISAAFAYCFHRSLDTTNAKYDNYVVEPFYAL